MNLDAADPGRITWPVPEPALPPGVHRAVAEATVAAATAYRAARGAHGRAELARKVGDGADGTPTMLVDALVEDAVAEAARRNGVNLLSEEAGFIDQGSDLTLVVDPVDGSSNAASGVPLSCFSAVLARDGVALEALTCWFDAGRCWWAKAGESAPFRTSGRKELAGAAVSLLRPRRHNADAWWRVARSARRVGILSTTCLEAALVADGSIDAFADPGGNVHRIMDLAAALVLLPAAGGVVLDVQGRPFHLEPDLSHRWSGVAAATPELGEALVAAINEGDGSDIPA
jgi:myo-inositol-1(or 4)-monophosphatase